MHAGILCFTAGQKKTRYLRLTIKNVYVIFQKDLPRYVPLIDFSVSDD